MGFSGAARESLPTGSIAFFHKTRRRAVLRLHALPLTRPIWVPKVFRHHTFKAALADGGEQPLAVLESRD